MIDDALLRPGRFDRVIKIDLPSLSDREEILRARASRMPLDGSVDLQWLAEVTDGFSGAELASVCQEAGLECLRESVTSAVVSRVHFEKALKRSR